MIDMDMDMEKLINNLENKSKEEIKRRIYKSMEGMADECEAEAKLIISDNSIDTGEFMNSIFTETWEEGDDIGFTMYDGIKYGIYHEKGTVKHWVPFYRYGKVSKPVLAHWGKRVLGLTEEEMLSMGGIKVEIKESQPFMKALLKANTEVEAIFMEVFSE